MDLNSDVRKVRINAVSSKELGKSGCEHPQSRIEFDDSSNQSLLSCRGSVTSTRSLCRICQSETGTMIKPCACNGTMGKIHENCLNEWVLHSRKECCEICKTEYAKSGNVLLPLREWRKPEMTSSNWIELVTVGGLLFSVVYMFTLFTERQFFYRLLVDGLPPREADVGRLLMLLLLFAFLFGGLYDITKKVKFYFRKQCKVRFINNQQNYSKSVANKCEDDSDSKADVSERRGGGAEPQNFDVDEGRRSEGLEMEPCSSLAPPPNHSSVASYYDVTTHPSAHTTDWISARTSAEAEVTVTAVSPREPKSVADSTL